MQAFQRRPFAESDSFRLYERKRGGDAGSRDGFTSKADDGEGRGRLWPRRVRRRRGRLHSLGAGFERRRGTAASDNSGHARDARRVLCVRADRGAYPAGRARARDGSRAAAGRRPARRRADRVHRGRRALCQQDVRGDRRARRLGQAEHTGFGIRGRAWHRAGAVSAEPCGAAARAARGRIRSQRANADMRRG